MLVYAGIAILINYTFSLAGPRHPALAILLLINCHWLANWHWSLLSRRKRARILVAWGEVHEWPMGGRASELFGRNSSPNKSGKCTKAKRMIFSYESVAISKKHTFRLWSRITASEWKRTTTLAILIHRSGWHFDCPLGGLLFPSPG